jgi:Ca2+-binding EF-hand superfamily protein
MVASIRWSLRLVIVSLMIGFSAPPVVAQPGSGRGFGGGGFGGDPREMQEQFFRRLDRNSNGVIDGEEFDTMPSFFRDTLRDSGRDFSRPMDQTEFSDLSRQAMERARSSGGGFGGGSFGGGSFGRGGPRPGTPEMRVPEGSDRGGDSGNRSGGGSESKDGSPRSDDRGDGRRFDRSDSPSRGDGNGDSKSSSKKSDKPAGFSFGPVTFKMPEQYRSKDRDGDGQIGLYEWSRSDFATFRKLDRDGDGFLTAAELIKAGGGKLPNAAIPTNVVVAAVDTAAAKSSSPNAEGDRSSPPRGADPGVAVSVGGGPSPGAAPSATAAPDTSDEVTRRAMQTFDALDRDKNGAISAEEWARSRTMRPQFERANANMYPPISREQFVAQFIKVNPGFSR